MQNLFWKFLRQKRRNIFRKAEERKEGRKKITTQGEGFTTKILRHRETQKISDIFMVLEK